MGYVCMSLWFSFCLLEGTYMHVITNIYVCVVNICMHKYVHTRVFVLMNAGVYIIVHVRAL